MSDKFVDYNTFKQVDAIPHNCISYLIQNSENIWKLIHPDYMTNDCLFKPNLTIQQKRSLIYTGQQEDSSSYRVFMDTSNDDAMEERSAILKIHPPLIVPINYVISTVTIKFECLCHYKVNSVEKNDYHTTRALAMVQELLECLNGQNVGGIGVLIADRRASLNNKIVGGKYAENYSGYDVVMSTQTV
jgi:hypothetical protein